MLTGSKRGLRKLSLQLSIVYVLNVSHTLHWVDFYPYTLKFFDFFIHLKITTLSKPIKQKLLMAKSTVVSQAGSLLKQEVVVFWCIADCLTPRYDSAYNYGQLWAPKIAFMALGAMIFCGLWNPNILRSSWAFQVRAKGKENVSKSTQVQRFQVLLSWPVRFSNISPK